jgi:hypothetical protein
MEQTNMKRDAKAEDSSIAEVGDTIEPGINWDIPNPFTQHKEDPAYRYYYAADRQGSGGTVTECESLGYERDPSQKSNAPGHVLMRIPMALWHRREQAQRRRQQIMQAGSVDAGGKFETPVEFSRHDAGLSQSKVRAREE